jgi:D-hydroxyproline dehydrogenase subunit gamma
MPNLRIETVPRGEALTVTVNGTPVQAFRGESVHAVLLAAGYLPLRRSRRLKAPRGFFCGMGICYECLVTIDGKPDQRACMRTVEPGMEIRFDVGDM